MEQTITLKAIEEHSQQGTYWLRDKQKRLFTTKVLELSPIKDVLQPGDAVCIMCDDEERLCVTAQLGSYYVPRNAEACKEYIKDTLGCIIHNSVLQTNDSLTTCVTQLAKDVAYSIITEHRDNQLLMMLCSFVERKGIVTHDEQIVAPEGAEGSDSDDAYAYGSDVGYDYEFSIAYDIQARQLRFIRKVETQYPDTHKALQGLCPLALYTFDSNDTSFLVPGNARARFLGGSEVMQLVTVIWPQIAEDAWTSGSALYNQKIMDVRSDHCKNLTLLQLCSFVVKTEAERKAEEMRKAADHLASCEWLLFKLSE